MKLKKKDHKTDQLNHKYDLRTLKKIKLFKKLSLKELTASQTKQSKLNATNQKLLQKVRDLKELTASQTDRHNALVIMPNAEDKIYH